MSPAMRHSLPVRIVAVGFSIAILGSNFWLCYWYFGNTAPLILTYFVQCGIVLAFFGAIAMPIQALFLKHKPMEEDEETSEPEGKSLD